MKNEERRMRNENWVSLQPGPHFPFAVFHSSFGLLSSMVAFLGEPALGVESSHAAGARGGDRLAVVAVGHVARREHPLDTGVRPLRSRPLDVAGFGQLQLAAHKV